MYHQQFISIAYVYAEPVSEVLHLSTKLYRQAFLSPAA